ncbi:hypothetical protein BN14_10308 [Rhizoctonia solani AG-1 IB]|uniref:Secreted protein n=1 Tax=Thanatephorus cucumeris (strain AG1-IB / isolate 7/3/14) TaxID=1108050 RepID=M5CAS8_THACB|nr:hypothetical protein BN14_10308 [Rhizoctonia solani AG-1 IB]
MLFPRTTRLVTTLSVVLAFGILACGSPIPNDNCPAVLGVVPIGCMVGNQMISAMTELNGCLDKAYIRFDVLQKNGTSTAGAMKDMFKCLDDGKTSINALPKDMAGSFDILGSDILDLQMKTLTGFREFVQSQIQRIFDGISDPTIRKFLETIDDMLDDLARIVSDVGQNAAQRWVVYC